MICARVIRTSRS